MVHIAVNLPINSVRCDELNLQVRTIDMTESARLALITGSSRGIGKAIAIDLAATGVDILATGRDETRIM